MIKFRPIWKRFTFRLRLNPAPPTRRYPAAEVIPDWADVTAGLEHQRQAAPTLEDAG